MAAPGAILRVREEGVAVLGVRAVHALLHGVLYRAARGGVSRDTAVGVPVDYGRRPSQEERERGVAAEAHRTRPL